MHTATLRVDKVPTYMVAHRDRTEVLRNRPPVDSRDILEWRGYFFRFPSMRENVEEFFDRFPS